MTTLSVDTGILIPTRDGTLLATTVIRPSGDVRCPAVVMRTLYDRKTYASESLQVHALALAEAGYAVVLQDVRGRGASGGVFTPFVNEQRDGVDTIEWVADQPWCDGGVGLAGISYNAFAQTAAMVADPDPVRAWVPGLAPFDVRSSWVRRGGVFDLGFLLSWGLGSIGPSDRRTDDPGSLLAAFSNPVATSRRGAQDQPELAATPAGSWFFDWLESDDPYPGNPAIPGAGDLAAVSAPALVVAGWFDVFSAGSLELLEALRSEAGGISHRLVAGPWDHSGLPLKLRAGDRDFGISAAVDLHALQIEWFNQHLRDGDEVVMDRIFVTGRDEWVSEPRWPPSTQAEVLYLGADGRLDQGSATAGRLVVDVDAGRPTPVTGGAIFPWEPALRPGSFDQRPRQAREDVLLFQSAPLEGPLLVVGRPRLRVAVESTAEQVPVCVTLSEAAPEGPVWNVADGVGGTDPSTGVAVIDLGPIAHEFAAGATISLDVAFAGDVRIPPVPSGTRALHLGTDSAALSLPVAR